MPESWREDPGRRVIQGARLKARKGSKKPTGAASGAGAPRRWPLWAGVVPGFIVGLFLWLAADRLGVEALPTFRSEDTALIAGVVAAVLWPTRGRVVVWVAAGLVTVLLMLVAYTPMMQVLMPRLVQTNPLRAADAVVVLSSDVQRDGEMNGAAQTRVLRGYEVLQQGYAPRLILTRLPPPKRSYVPVVTAQMRRLRVERPIDEVGPVGNTHDEAVAVGELARRRGWKRIILVSDPSHLWRAGSVFRKQGLEVVCVAGPERDYDISSLTSPGQRLRAFNDWVREYVGYYTYRVRGWI